VCVCVCVCVCVFSVLKGQIAIHQKMLAYTVASKRPPGQNRWHHGTLYCTVIRVLILPVIMTAGNFPILHVRMYNFFRCSITRNGPSGVLDVLPAKARSLFKWRKGFRDRVNFRLGLILVYFTS